MRRRTAVRALAVGGGAWLGGCGTDDGGASPGNDDDPFGAAPGDLLPPVGVLEDVLDADWEPREEIETGLVERAQGDAAYEAVDDETHVTVHAVEVGAWTFEDVEAARAHYDDLPYQEGWGMPEGDVAVESREGVLDSDREYRIVFRDADAIGGLAYLNPRRGNADEMRETGRDLAAAMHRYWRD